MKIFSRFFSFVFNFFFRFGRFLAVGFLSAIGLVFISNELLAFSSGKTDINLLILLFSFFPLFLALFIELLAYFNRRSSKKQRLSREVDHLKLK